MTLRLRELFDAVQRDTGSLLKNVSLLEAEMTKVLGPPDDPEPQPERIKHGPGRLREATTTFGPKLGPVPKNWINANLDRREPARAASVVANICKEAKADGAENVILTVPLAWITGTYKSNPSGSLKAMQAVANGEHDDVYRGIAGALVAAGYPNAILRLGHEHNMTWAPWYSGNGRAADFVAAWCQAQDIIRAIAPGVVYDWNIGASGADPDSDTGSTWVPASWPGDDRVDVVGRDIYCRSNGRKPAVVQRALIEHAEWAKAHGKPVSYPEVGITLGPNPAATDEKAAAFLEQVFEFANGADLAYFVWWASNRTDQGYRYRPTKADEATWAVLQNAYG